MLDMQLVYIENNMKITLYVKSEKYNQIYQNKYLFFSIIYKILKKITI